MKVKGLVKGGMVWYTTHESDLHPTQKSKAGNTVVAIVTQVVDKEAGTVNLTLFPDGATDGFLNFNRATPDAMLVAAKAGAEYSEESAPGTWRWPSKE